MLNTIAVKKAVQREKPLLVKLLRDLVRTESPSGQEGRACKLIFTMMKKAGFDEIRVSKSGSVIGRIGNGKVKILYDAHVDTVPVGDPGQWKHKPFSAVYRQGIVHGRGACDDKGSVSAMVFAGRLLKKLKATGDYTLWISASVLEEEADGRGIEDVIEVTGKPDYVIIGEPSSLKIIRGHKGRMGVKITAEGRPVHASIPGKGINAIYRMVPIVNRVKAMNARFTRKSLLGRSTVSVTGIESGGTSHNTVPGRCTIFLDRRTTEKETGKGIMAELKKLAGKDGKVEVVKKYFPAWMLENNHPLLGAAKKTYGKVFSKKAGVYLWPFCTNGSYSMGELGIPTLGFGPGDENLCHSPQERIAVDEVIKAAEFYTVLPGILAG